MDDGKQLVSLTSAVNVVHFGCPSKSGLLMRCQIAHPDVMQHASNLSTHRKEAWLPICKAWAAVRALWNMLLGMQAKTALSVQNVVSNSKECCWTNDDYYCRNRTMMVGSELYFYYLRENVTRKIDSEFF